MLHDGRLNSPITSFFYGSSNQAMWNLHIVASLDTEWEISQEFLLPSKQLITKCKRRAKLNGKIKRSKLSHLYYSNSVVTDRLVLAGDVEANPGTPNDQFVVKCIIIPHLMKINVIKAFSGVFQCCWENIICSFFPARHTRNFPAS